MGAPLESLFEHSLMAIRLSNERRGERCVPRMCTIITAIQHLHERSDSENGSKKRMMVQSPTCDMQMILYWSFQMKKQ